MNKVVPPAIYSSSNQPYGTQSKISFFPIFLQLQIIDIND